MDEPRKAVAVIGTNVVIDCGTAEKAHRYLHEMQDALAARSEPDYAAMDEKARADILAHVGVEGPVIDVMSRIQPTFRSEPGAEGLREAIAQATPLMNPRLSEVDWDEVARLLKPLGSSRPVTQGDWDAEAERDLLLLDIRRAAQRLIDHLDVREHYEDATGIRRVDAASPYVSDIRAALGAAESAAIWLEAEAEHPRDDPRPAMRLQASILRNALAATPAADSRGLDVERLMAAVDVRCGCINVESWDRIHTEHVIAQYAALTDPDPVTPPKDWPEGFSAPQLDADLAADETG